MVLSAVFLWDLLVAANSSPKNNFHPINHQPSTTQHSPTTNPHAWQGRSKLGEVLGLWHRTLQADLLKPIAHACSAAFCAGAVMVVVVGL